MILRENKSKIIAFGIEYEINDKGESLILIFQMLIIKINVINF